MSDGWGRSLETERGSGSVDGGHGHHHSMPSGQPTEAYPRLLNLGSGKDFREDCLNIDIEDTWAPDAVIDLSRVNADGAGIRLSTVRFGEITLRPECLDGIIANDVLEHVPDLMSFMTTCLRLLRFGGVFEIAVPYDLSYGAWQDPTHVRAFNERSWLYYTEWFWYMGWSDARFELERLQFALSPHGHELKNKGVPSADLVRTPRAVDAMNVRLRKIALTEQDQQTWRHWRERREEAAKRNALSKGSMAATLEPASVFPAAEPVCPPAPVAQPVPASAASPAGLFTGGWEGHRDRHCIWVISPEGYAHHQAFAEVAEVLSEAFAELGGSAPIVHHPDGWQGRLPIILGGNLLDPRAASTLPQGSVIFNLEQVQNGSVWINENYLSTLKKFQVLDYSRRNLAALIARGVSHARLLPIGYSRSLTRIKHAPVKDIDVLFYGSMNERRKQVLSALAARGVKVVSLFDCYGARRDEAIGRSKIALNMHFYKAAIFEVVRVSYLLANGVCVVTEGDPRDVDLLPFAEGMAIGSVEALAEMCVDLLGDDPRREALAARGFRLVTQRRQSDLLRPLFDAAPGANGSTIRDGQQERS